MCQHINCIEDIHTDDTICTDCGVVLTSLTPSLNNFISENLNLLPPDFESLKNKISDILAHLFIFSESIINFCAKQSLEVMQCMKNKSLINKYLAFSIFESLNILEIPCSPHSISSILDIHAEDILKLEKKLGRGIVQCPPFFFVDKITSCLNFPFSFTKQVKEKTKLYQDMCYSKPETLIAGIILFQIQIEKEKNHDISFCKHVNAKFLGQFLGIAEGSIYRILKELRNMN